MSWVKPDGIFQLHRQSIDVHDYAQSRQRGKVPDEESSDRLRLQREPFDLAGTDSEYQFVSDKVEFEVQHPAGRYRHGRSGRNGCGYARDVERRLVDPEACVREMDRAGIEMCIMSLTSPGVQSVIDPKQAVELARTANDYAADFIRKYPARFLAFAAVALQYPESAADELERAVTEFGLKGALIVSQKLWAK